MKKTMKFIGLIAMAAVLFSCDKKNIDTPVENPQGTETPSDLSQLDPGKYLVSFGATIESVDTKANVDLITGDVSFVDGDEVLVVSGSASGKYKYSGDKFAPLDESNAVEMSADMKAYYPADNYSVSSNVVTFTMPEATEENPGSLAPMCAIINGSTAEFKNLGAILKLKLTAGEAITAVELVASKPIAGSSELSWNAGGIPKLSAELNGASNVKHYFTTAIPAGTATTLYFFLPAGIETELEIHAIYGKTVGEVTYEPYKKIKRNSKLTTVRNYVFSIAKILPGFFSAGDGSKDTPYEIANADDFKAIANLANADAEKDGNGFNTTANRTFFGSEGVHYVQTANINFNKEELSSIGVYNATEANAIPFQGVYDGDGKHLSSFKVSGDNDVSTGLFEYVDGASLKNIAIEQCSVTGTNTTGILTGRCIGASTIEGCSATQSEVTGRNSVGLIAHITERTTVKSCMISNLSIITASNGAEANNQGGIVGYAGGSSSIESCNTSGYIQFAGVESGTARGGIVGKFDSTGNVSSCTNGANINSIFANYTGGIAGQLTKGTITKCINTGNVTGRGYVGGITGAMLASSNACVYINECRVNASIVGTGANNSDICVGGIVGSMQNGVLNSCFAKGSVENSFYDTGGIVGQIYANGNSGVYNRPYVFDCIAANDVKCTRTSGSANIGGVVGRLMRKDSYTNQYSAIDNCIGLNQTITSNLQYSGAFIGNINAGSKTNNNRVRVRNCISLVDDSHFNVTTTTANTGGFVGGYLGAIIYCYYLVSNNNQTAATGSTTANNLTQSELATLTGAEFCATLNTRATEYNLTVNSVVHKSSGWTLPSDCSYPVPTTLYNLGSDYYK